jgi:hypothetical protein
MSNRDGGAKSPKKRATKILASSVGKDASLYATPAADEEPDANPERQIIQIKSISYLPLVFC